MGRPARKKRVVVARWKILARHSKWVVGATITELLHVDGGDDAYRRFIATIRGYRNWHIWQGVTANLSMKPHVTEIIRRVTAIRDRIDAHDEKIFTEPGAW